MLSIEIVTFSRSSGFFCMNNLHTQKCMCSVCKFVEEGTMQFKRRLQGSVFKLSFPNILSECGVTLGLLVKRITLSNGHFAFVITN